MKTFLQKDIWEFEKAKTQFSKLIDEVQKKGMRRIAKNGKVIAVLLSIEEFEKKSYLPNNNLIDFFKESPFPDLDLKIERLN